MIWGVLEFLLVWGHEFSRVPRNTKPTEFSKTEGGVGGGRKTGEGVSSFSRKYPPACGINPPLRIYRYPKGVPPLFVEKPPRWGGSIRYRNRVFFTFLGVFTFWWGVFSTFWVETQICLRRDFAISSTFVHKFFAIVVGINSAFCYSLHLQLDPKWVAIVEFIFIVI